MPYVLKANGDKELFDEEKVRASIARAGIPHNLTEQVISHVKEKLYDDIPTSEIYHHIKEFLKKSGEPYTAAKYGLKRAIMALGPTGYPFEDFIAKILETQGFTTSVRNIMKGKCISHEIDVIAEKGSRKIMVEAKFHNLPGNKTNVHVALYTKARFNDLLEHNNLNEAWLVTNTKITTDAISYALCMGMKVISWDYPEGESLRDIVEKSGLSPVTALSSLTEEEKERLAKNRIILARDICNDESCLNISNIPADKHEEVVKEVKYLTNQYV